jgi:hypothetical protein
VVNSKLARLPLGAEHYVTLVAGSLGQSYPPLAKAQLHGVRTTPNCEIASTAEAQTYAYALR